MNLAQLLKRSYRAWTQRGCLFLGTSRFNFPSEFKIKGVPISISKLGEKGEAWDFINLVLDDEYGLEAIDSQPKTVLDVGANIGLFSLLALERFPHATIHAYEPNSRAYKCAAANLLPWGLKVFDSAVGLEEGRIRIVEHGDSRLARTMAVNDGEVLQIPFRVALERIGGAVDLLKLDCEGAEWEIFKDHQSLKRVRMIRMEYHLFERQTVQDVFALVRSAGFEVERHTPFDQHGMLWLNNSQS